MNFKHHKTQYVYILSIRLCATYFEICNLNVVYVLSLHGHYYIHNLKC
jgi:hypothetical protein